MKTRVRGVFGWGRQFAREIVPRPGPARPLAVMTLAHTVGLGLYATSLVIFLTQDRGLSPHHVGLVLSLAGGLGFLSSVPAGRVVDRFSPRACVAVTYVLLGSLLVVLAMSRSTVVTGLAIAGITVVETANSPMRAALVFALFGSTEGTKVRSQMRSVSNAGFASGALLASLGLAVGSHAAYVVMFLVAGVGYLSCVGLLALVPAPAPMPASVAATKSGGALRDYAFVAVALVSGVVELHVPLLLVGIPAWIVSWTSVQPTWQAALMVVNTVLVVLLQVRASRGAETATGAAAMQRRAGLVLALSCLVFAATLWSSSWITIVLLLSGTVVLTWGELLQSAGAYGLAFDLPPTGRQGEYQGVFALGRGFQAFLGPLLITATVISWGLAGWLLMAVLFVAAGQFSPLATKFALRRRSEAELSLT